ncbi:ABC transporter substrate-binding protein [Rhodococcus jostii]|uniref:Peptide/nickel transport system substrate-binding protein n=1 Tax=Rhodococcus jostii TaxID=132919 RepID=A0A1H4JEJ2_RHOJO|nr:ABC transporter substrate-binding protein [Rhodococcus jostii]SEB44505.1 peptide/nickel transport system substrate-binding protein [Rhodococcus jostii]
MTKRVRNLLAIGVTAATILGLAACTADPEPGSGSGAPTSQPHPGGTFTLALSTYPQRGLNPHYGASFDASQVLRNVYDSLVSADENEQFHPWLATAWTISPDGLIYDFHLRQDVTFQDGERFDAHAVKTNIDLARNPGYPGYSDVGVLNYSSVNSVEVVDPYHVRIALNTPRADFLSTLSGIGGAIVSPRSLSNRDSWASGEGFVGTGPFKLDKAVPGQELDFRKNPDYNWPPATASHQGPAYVDELVVKYIPEASTRAGLLESGEVDAIGTVKAEDIGLFQGISGYQYEQKGSSGSPKLLYLNVTNGPTTDKRVRQALTTGVDLNSVIQNVTRGTQDRAWSIISPQSRYFDGKYQGSNSVNIVRANTLLDEAGWRDRDSDNYRVNSAGDRLTIRVLASVPGYPEDDFLKAWQAELRQNLGVEVELKYVENALVYDLLAQNQYEAFPRQVGGLDLSLQLNRGFGSVTPDIKYGQVDGITLGSVVAGSKLADKQVDEWLLNATKATDQDARKQWFDKIAQYVHDNAVAIPLYTDRNSAAATANVHGLHTLFDAPRNVVNGWSYDIAVDR